MVKLIVLFRAGTHSSNYEERYNEFLMSLEQLPGMRRKSVSNVYAAPGGMAHYRDVVEITFDDRSALEAALTSPAGVEAGNRLIRFAGPDAITLFAEVMEEDYPPAAG
jgi:uncharacterized protein (TIGR02118 family)